MIASRLLSPLRAPANAAVRSFLDGSAEAGRGAARDVDFTAPAGEPALISADSVSWRVFKNPAAVFIGGVAAVILELAEPRVRAGVWEHTRFRAAPRERIRRTGLAAMVTVYGARSAAEAMIARVRAMHAQVRGTTPEGEPYAADDPELLTWVQATAAFGFAEAYSAYVRPLESGERDRFYAEGQEAARLYGAVAAPTSQAEMDALLDGMTPRLAPSPVIFEFLKIVRSAPILPPAARGLQAPMVKAAVAITPAAVRRRLGFGRQWTANALDHGIVKLAGRAADAIVLDESPAAQACRRLGLPADWLWRR